MEETRTPKEAAGDDQNSGQEFNENGQTPPEEDSGQTLKFGENDQSPGENLAAEKFQKLADEWKSKAAYLAAEMDNMKKRFARDRVELLRIGNEELLKKILPVVDNLELAVKAARDAEAKVEKEIKNHPAFSGLLKGIDMTLKHFEQTLEQTGVLAVKSLGVNFDPTQHEAIGQSKEAEHDEGKITGELQKGYTYQGKVLRPSKVIVNRK